MVHTFPKGICPKVNVIARLEYELAYYDSAVNRFNHYTTRTPHTGDYFVAANFCEVLTTYFGITVNSKMVHQIVENDKIFKVDFQD